MRKWTFSDSTEVLVSLARIYNCWGYVLYDPLKTISFLQTSTDTFKNSADTDESTRHEPSHPDLHC